jgi:putative polyketide hydroxylase
MNNNHDELHVPVLIVGAGPAGLMMSLLLARHGVRSMVIERHAGTSILPRATGINVRTMEIFRSLGLEAAIRAIETDVRGLPVLTEMETLRGPVIKSVPNVNSSSGGDPDWPSPTRQSFCSQDVLEPLLVETLGESPLSDLRFNTEVVRLEQDPSGVSVTLSERVSGTACTVRTDFLIAADGAHSPVREALRIGMEGHDQMDTMINVLFEADLSQVLAGKRSIVFRLRNRWLPQDAIFRNNDGRNRWTLIAQNLSDASPSHLVEIIRGCAESPQLGVEIVATGTWIKAALLADRFRDGRVFLVGDAAHRLAPAGAMGMNIAIQGVHNLAWKLAAVINGWAGSELLNTYETERRPVSSLSVELSYQNERSGEHARPILGLMLGTAYDSGALMPDGSNAPEAADGLTTYVPTARPGHRAPHCWLSINARRTSAIDLFDGRFVVLSASGRWSEAAHQAGTRLGIPMAAHVIHDSQWASLYGIGQDGAVLVRPDGYVAWRRHQVSDDPERELERAVEMILALKRAETPQTKL